MPVGHPASVRTAENTVAKRASEGPAADHRTIRVAHDIV
jgi:hypothetical protein